MSSYCLKYRKKKQKLKSWGLKRKIKVLYLAVKCQDLSKSKKFEDYY